MTIDLTETTTGAIASALQQARQRLGGPASGMVLTLVIVTDETSQYDAVRAANEAAREHPCRVLVVITRRPTAASRLDAEIRVGETSPRRDPAAAHVRPARPARGLGGGAAAAAGHAGRHLVAGRAARGPRHDPIGVLSQRRITDAAAVERAPGVPDRARGRLPAGRHRPELDQGDPLAVAARRHARPAARHDPVRPRSGPSRGTRAPI